MSNEKLFTAKQAAVAVLAKAQEVLAKNALLKAPAEKDQTPPAGIKADPNPAAPNPKVNGNPAPGSFPQNQEKYAAEGVKKGHLALAKFMGRMEHKRSQAKHVAAEPAPHAPAEKAVEMDKAETGHEKGVNRASAQPTQGLALVKEDKLNSAVFSTVDGSKMRSGSPGLKEGMGTSQMGSHVRRDTEHNDGRAKEIAQKQLKNMKAAPKPKLPG